MEYVLGIERKNNKGSYWVYHSHQTATGMVINTDKLEHAKKFLSETAAKYEVYNSGQNMEDQHYKVIPVAQ